MAFQSTFSGRRQVAKTNNLLELANTLNNYATPALNEYASYKGAEITEKTDREAELKARSTEAKSYSKAVANGELDGTQSPYWQSVYDNVKGKNHGIEFGISKQNALNEWIQTNIAEDPNWEDKDGTKYFQWSNNYDVQYFKETLDGESAFFKKGLDGLVAQTNANIGQSYTKYIKDRQHELLKINLEKVLMDAIDKDLLESDEAGEYMAISGFFRALDTEGSNAKLLAGLKGDEFNTIALNAAKSMIDKYAIVGDPNANFDKAFAILDAVKKYKRTNGSNLFNAQSSQEWSTLEQTLYSEQERHENLIEQKENEIMQHDFVVAEMSALKNGFTGGALASFDPQAQDKANFAADAFGILMKDWIKKNPDIDLNTEEGLFKMKKYSNDLREAVSDYYEIRFGEDVKIFDFYAFRYKEESQRIANIPLAFNSVEEAELAVSIYNEDGTGPLADLMTMYGIEDVRTIYEQQRRQMLKAGWVFSE